LITVNRQTPRRPPAYNAGVPWTSSQQLMTPRAGGTLYRYRDPTGTRWWSDGHALFRGYVPGYLRLAYLRAARPVDVPVEPLMLAIMRDRTGVRLDPPLFVYELPGEHGIVPVAVFAASGADAELHVDARYLAYAEARFTDATFWRVGEATVAVRNERGLMGLIDGQDRPAGGRDS
jgi:hypothetical protein